MIDSYVVLFMVEAPRIVDMQSTKLFKGRNVIITERTQFIQHCFSQLVGNQSFSSLECSTNHHTFVAGCAIEPLQRVLG